MGTVAFLKRGKTAHGTFSVDHGFERQELSVLKAVVFDVHGTLIDPVDAHAQCGGFAEADLRKAGVVVVFRDPADILARWPAFLEIARA